MKSMFRTRLYRDVPKRIPMLFPSIFCTLSLLLCGLYPLAKSALPAPRASEVQRVEPDAVDVEFGPSASIRHDPSEAGDVANGPMR